MNKFNIKKVTDLETWDLFVNSSPQGAYFNYSFFIKSLEKKSELFFIYKGDKLHGGICLFLNKDKDIINDPFFIYSNILFKNFSNLKNVSRNMNEYYLCDFIVNFLTKNYNKISINLDPSILDIRPFLWHNYSGYKKKFNLNLKFTSYLNISKLKKKETENEFFENLKNDKKTIIRNAIKNKCRVSFTKKYDQLLNLYKKLVKLNNIDIKNSELNSLKLLLDNSLKRNDSIIANVYDGEAVVYSTMYFWDNKRAYYFLGAGDKNLNKWHSTFCHYEMFKYLAKNTNISYIDLEGINSPLRGNNKLGYGGEIKIYYNLELL